MEDKKVYYIGRALEEYPENWEEVGVRWDIMGIYSTKELAFENVDDDEFIVKVNLDEKLPKELCQPDEYWWCVNGLIEDKNGNGV